MTQPVLPSSPLPLPAGASVVQTYQPRPSLSLLYKQHRDVQEARRVQNDVKRKAVVEAVAKVSESMMDGINYGVARVFANQKKIDTETKQLENQTQRYTKVTTQWIEMVDKFNDALKEMGDLENWALAIEREMQQVSNALVFVHKRSQDTTPPVNN